VKYVIYSDKTNEPLTVVDLPFDAPPSYMWRVPIKPDTGYGYFDPEGSVEKLSFPVLEIHFRRVPNGDGCIYIGTTRDDLAALKAKAEILLGQQGIVSDAQDAGYVAGHKDGFMFYALLLREFGG